MSEVEALRERVRELADRLLFPRRGDPEQLIMAAEQRAQAAAAAHVESVKRQNDRMEEMERSLYLKRAALAPSQAPPAQEPERIVASAVRRTVSAEKQGHHVCFGRLANAEDTAPSFQSTEQGFLTDAGRYVNREEALAIARSAGQLEGRTKHRPEHLLMSEDLWDQHELPAQEAPSPEVAGRMEGLLIQAGMGTFDAIAAVAKYTDQESPKAGHAFVPCLNPSYCPRAGECHHPGCQLPESAHPALTIDGATVTTYPAQGPRVTPGVVEAAKRAQAMMRVQDPAQDAEPKA